jgi:hypothetical protein
MSWKKSKQVEDYFVPRIIQDITGQVRARSGHRVKNIGYYWPGEN